MNAEPSGAERQDEEALAQPDGRAAAAAAQARALDLDHDDVGARAGRSDAQSGDRREPARERRGKRVGVREWRDVIECRPAWRPLPGPSDGYRRQSLTNRTSAASISSRRSREGGARSVRHNPCSGSPQTVSKPRAELARRSRPSARGRVEDPRAVQVQLATPCGTRDGERLRRDIGDWQAAFRPRGYGCFQARTMRLAGVAGRAAEPAACCHDESSGSAGSPASGVSATPRKRRRGAGLRGHACAPRRG